MEIIKQITAKSKAYNIIDSCKNSNHYEVAHKYIKLYYINYEDFVGKNELERYLQDHKISMLTP